MNTFFHNWRAAVSAELKQILQNTETIMAGQKELDAAIAGLVTDIGTQTTLIKSTAQSIIDKIAAGATPTDLQPEIDQLTAAQASLDGIAGQLPTTPTPPVTPAPTP